MICQICKIAIFILIFSSGLYAQVPVEKTMDRIEEMISNQTSGAYFCFDKADIDLAMGENFWDQIEMEEMLAFNHPNVLKSLFLPSNALNGQRPEDRWALTLFNRVMDSWTEYYAPLGPSFLSTVHREKCVRFLEFLRSQNLVLVSDLEIPLATRELLFGLHCKWIPISEIDVNTYTVAVLAMSPSEKLLAKKLFDQPIFLIDLSGLREALCNWNIETWAKWVQKQNNIKILYTSALIPHKFEERKQEYIRCLKTLESYGFKEQVYIAESGPYTPLSFFENYCDHVFYANTNDASLINKGVNEAKATIAAFDYFDFDDEDMIVKITGRYLFNNDYFLQLVKTHPEMDAFASYFEDKNRGVTTGCFAMRYKYYKQMVEELDLEKMEENLIDVEWEVAQFLEKMGKGKVMYLDKVGISANVANVGVKQW